jgi:hypothetical protein
MKIKFKMKIKIVLKNREEERNEEIMRVVAFIDKK